MSEFPRNPNYSPPSTTFKIHMVSKRIFLLCWPMTYFWGALEQHWSQAGLLFHLPMPFQGIRSLGPWPGMTVVGGSPCDTTTFPDSGELFFWWGGSEKKESKSFSPRTRHGREHWIYSIDTNCHLHVYTGLERRHGSPACSAVQIGLCHCMGFSTVTQRQSLMMMGDEVLAMLMNQ